jgi:hypothetical protein
LHSHGGTLLTIWTVTMWLIIAILTLAFMLLGWLGLPGWLVDNDLRWCRGFDEGRVRMHRESQRSRGDRSEVDETLHDPSGGWKVQLMQWTRNWTRAGWCILVVSGDSDYCATVRLADTAMMGVKGGGKTVYKYW